MTFGRKGLAPGEAFQPSQPTAKVSRSPFANPAIPSRSVGTSQKHDPIASKREAFIAAERERSAADGGAIAGHLATPYLATSGSGGQISDVAQSFKGRKKGGFMGQFSPKKPSLIIAYLLWFSFCNIGAHRIYLGEIKGGLYQVALLIGSLVLAFAVWMPFAMGVIVWMLWIISDVFVIHKWHRKRVEEAEFDTSVFA